MAGKTIEHYHQNAALYQAQYDSLKFEDVHAVWMPLFAQLTPGMALDIGAGTGRDALWLLEHGWKVTAIEPAQGLRQTGQKKTGPTVQWLDDQMPALNCLKGSTSKYDLILLSAVWMHLPPSERPLTFQRLMECLSADGLMIMTIRIGPSDPNRPMYVISDSELQSLALENAAKLEVLCLQNRRDCLNRDDVSWKTVCFRHLGSVEE